MAYINYWLYQDKNLLSIVCIKFLHYHLEHMLNIHYWLNSMCGTCYQFGDKILFYNFRMYLCQHMLNNLLSLICKECNQNLHLQLNNNRLNNPSIQNLLNIFSIPPYFFSMFHICYFQYSNKNLVDNLCISSYHYNINNQQ
jgi:hypothetical protein